MLPRTSAARWLIGTATALFLVAWGPIHSTLAASDLPIGGWSDAGKLNTQRPAPLATLLADGRVLVTGISGQDYNSIGSIDIYDPAGTWSLGPSLASDPVGAVLAPLPGGGALLAGGVPWNGGYDGPGPGPKATAFVYDKAAGAWTKAPDMLSIRSNASATAFPDGRVLVVGGYDRSVTQLPNPAGQPFCCLEVKILPLATTEWFDPGSRTWSPGPPLNQARYGHTATALQGGQILVVGGSDQQSFGNSVTSMTSAELFDPRQGKWLSAGSIGVVRKGFTLTPLLDGRALIAGGTTADGTTDLRSTLIYDPTSNQWSHGPDMIEARSDHAAARLKDGRLVVVGGSDPLGRMASSEVFDPARNAWSPAGALTTARSGHVAITLQDGRVLVIGGTGSLAPLDSAELFDPTHRGVSPPPRTVTGPGRWQIRSPQPSVTFNQSARLLRSGNVLVLPGSNYGEFVAQLYDPITDRWTTPIDRTSDQSFIGGTVLADDRIFLVTSDAEGRTPAKAEIIDLPSGAVHAVASPGNLSSAQLNLLPDGRVWLTSAPYGDRHTQFYDPAADRWSPGPDFPADLYIGTVTPLSDGRVLVGGITGAMILDLQTGAWSGVGVFPVRWESYSATRLPSGDVLFAGGFVDEQPDPNRTVQVATTQVMRWNHETGLLTRLHDMPQPQSLHSTVVLGNGQVLFAGGIHGNPGSDAETNAELFDPVKDSWTVAASLPAPRAQATAVVLRDGRALIVGGYGFFGGPPTLEYVPDARAALQSPSVASATSYVAIEVVATMVLLVLAVLIAANARRRWRAR
jgi:hypothetical protein